jgi:hypothetical protein
MLKNKYQLLLLINNLALKGGAWTRACGSKNVNEKIKTRGKDHKFIFIFNRTELKGIKRKTAKFKIRAAKKRAVTERPG